MSRAAYDAVMPDPQTPGARLRVKACPYIGWLIAIERTLPERVERLDAQRVEVLEEITLTPELARWLHARLGELIATEDA